jgi:hypothetical protein
MGSLGARNTQTVLVWLRESDENGLCGPPLGPRNTQTVLVWLRVVVGAFEQDQARPRNTQTVLVWLRGRHAVPLSRPLQARNTQTVLVCENRHLNIMTRGFRQDWPPPACNTLHTPAAPGDAPAGAYPPGPRRGPGQASRTAVRPESAGVRTGAPAAMLGLLSCLDGYS